MVTQQQTFNMVKKVQLFIEDKEVQLYGDESFVLSYTIDDINDIGSKAASYSKEIAIPSTDINDQIFTSLFDVTIEGGFNPISRKRAILYVDSLPVMQGYFKLLSINIKDKEYVNYSGLLYEEQINFIQALDDYLLENLNIPVTGTTTSLIGPYTQVANFAFTGIGDRWGTGIYSNGLYWCDATSFGGLAFTGGTYGILSSQNRTKVHPRIPGGCKWNPEYMQAYEATSDQLIDLWIDVDLLTISYAQYQVRIVKSDYTTPVSGLYTDITLYDATWYSSTSSSSGIGHSCKITAGTAPILTNIPLQTGDKFRIEIWCFSGNNYTTRDTSRIYGNVKSGALVATTGITTNLASIVTTTNNVNTSDDGAVVFPLIDYSQNYTFLNVNVGSYNYGTNNSIGLLNINMEDLRPMVFVKRVWDAIFKQAGFKYKSSFLNDSTFKKMVIGGGIDEDEISTLVYSTYVNPTKASYTTNLKGTQDTQLLNTAGQVTNYTYNEFHFGNARQNPVSGSTTDWFINNVYIDPYTTFAPAKNFVNVNAHSVTFSPGSVMTNYYGYANVHTTPPDYGFFMTAAVDGKYSIDGAVEFISKPVKNNAGTISYNLPLVYKLQLQKLSIGSYKYFPNSSTAPTYDKWDVVKEVYVTRAVNTADQTFSLRLNEDLDLKRGDMLRLILMGDADRQFATGGSTPYASTVVINPAQDKTYQKFYRKGTCINTTIDNVSQLLPKDMKQRDFILQIAKMFNLYFEADKEDPRTLIIEPRDTYYELGRVYDWSRRINYSQDFNIDILSHDFPKTSIFKYKDDDKDYYSTKYADVAANKLIFGSYKFISPNEYNIDEKTLELTFAPSYVQKIDNTDIIITKIIDPSTKDSSSNSGNVTYKIQPRIMMYKKKAFSNTNYAVTIGNVKTEAYTPYLSTSSSPIYQNTYSYQLMNYGYAGHVDDPVAPTFDLNWYTDFNYLPTGTTTGTTQNLINVFYKQQLIELTDQTARKVTAFVDLKPSDIVNFRFCDIFYFNKEYWRCLTIEDFDTSSDVNQTTRCTFIKIVRAQTNYLIDYQAFGYLGKQGGSAGGISGGIFGSTDPVTGLPLLRSKSGTEVVDTITRATYFDIIAERNLMAVNVVEAGNTVVNTSTNVIQDPKFGMIADIAATKDVTLSLQTQIDNVSVVTAPGDVLVIDKIYPEGATIGISNYKRVLIDVQYRAQPFNVNIFTTDIPDGQTIQFSANTGMYAGIVLDQSTSTTDCPFFITDGKSLKLQYDAIIQKWVVVS